MMKCSSPTDDLNWVFLGVVVSKAEFIRCPCNKKNPPTLHSHPTPPPSCGGVAFSYILLS